MRTNSTGRHVHCYEVSRGTWVRCVRVTGWVIKFPCNLVNTMLTPSVKLAFLTWLSLIRFRHSSIGRTLLKYYTFVIQAFLSYVYKLRVRHHLKLSGQHLAEYSTEQISGDFFSEFALVDVYYSKKRRTASVWLQLRRQACTFGAHFSTVPRDFSVYKNCIK